MNQRGEVSLFCVLLIFACMGLVLLCGLELKKSFHLLRKRTDLYLCAKETKGEIHEYLTFMGRTNWGIRNLEKASLIMVFIPGAQGAALEAQKMKKFLKATQNLRLISYLKMLHGLKKRSCPIDPRLLMTPFELNASVYARDNSGAAKLRKKTWTYSFNSYPYLLSLTIQAQHMERIKPKMTYLSEEKGVRLSSLLSSR